MVSLLYLQNSLILSELIQCKKFAFGQERQNLCPDFNCSQKCRHTRSQTAVQQVASCELTLLTLQHAKLPGENQSYTLNHVAHHSTEPGNEGGWY